MQLKVNPAGGEMPVFAGPIKIWRLSWEAKRIKVHVSEPCEEWCVSVCALQRRRCEGSGSIYVGYQRKC